MAKILAGVKRVVQRAVKVVKGQTTKNVRNPLAHARSEMKDFFEHLRNIDENNDGEISDEELAKVVKKGEVMLQKIKDTPLGAKLVDIVEEVMQDVEEIVQEEVEVDDLHPLAQKGIETASNFIDRAKHVGHTPPLVNKDAIDVLSGKTEAPAVETKTPAAPAEEKKEGTGEVGKKKKTE